MSVDMNEALVILSLHISTFSMDAQHGKRKRSRKEDQYYTGAALGQSRPEWPAEKVSQHACRLAELNLSALVSRDEMLVHTLWVVKPQRLTHNFKLRTPIWDQSRPHHKPLSPSTARNSDTSEHNLPLRQQLFLHAVHSRQKSCSKGLATRRRLRPAQR